MNRPWAWRLATACLIATSAAVDGEDLVVLHSKHVWTLTQPGCQEGYIVIEQGKIKTVTNERQFPETARLIELPQQHVVPGLIDAHTHVGLSIDPLSETDETIRPWAPEVRILEAYDPQSDPVRHARSAGITSVLLAPGQQNPLGGQTALVKLDVGVPEKWVVTNCAGLKGALSQQTLMPDRNPTSRPGLIALLRAQWQQAQQSATPASSPGLLVVQDVLAQRLPWFVHAQTDDEIEAALQLAREFKIRLVLVGIQPRSRGVELLKKQPTPVILPPLLRLSTNQEIQALVEILNTGVPFAFGSFAPRTDPTDLRTSAVLAVQHGLDRYRALQGLTSEAASLLGTAGRVGSIEPGKDADLVVMSGDPMELTSRVEMVWINGRLVGGTRPSGKSL